jgi:hypothetical protein
VGRVQRFGSINTVHNGIDCHSDDPVDALTDASAESPTGLSKWLLLVAADFSARGDRRQRRQAAEQRPVVLGNWFDGIGLASRNLKVCFGSRARIQLSSEPGLEYGDKMVYRGGCA